MDKLISLFPLSRVKKGDVVGLVVSIVIYVVVAAIIGVVLGLIGALPIIGLITGIVGTLIWIYCSCNPFIFRYCKISFLHKKKVYFNPNEIYLLFYFILQFYISKCLFAKSIFIWISSSICFIRTNRYALFSNSCLSVGSGARFIS